MRRLSGTAVSYGSSTSGLLRTRRTVLSSGCSMCIPANCVGSFHFLQESKQSNVDCGAGSGGGGKVRKERDVGRCPLLSSLRGNSVKEVRMAGLGRARS